MPKLKVNFRLKNKIKSCFVCLLFVFSFSLVSFSNAQFLNPSSPTAVPISSIQIQGNQTVSTDAIVNMMDLKVGKSLTKDAVARDIKSIFESGFFQDVQFSLVQATNLVVHVVEKPTIDSLSYEGFNGVTDTSLKDKIVSKQYTILDEKKLSQDLHTIEQAYVEKGYYLAKATYTLIELQKGSVQIVFKVTENKPIVVRRVDLIGNEYFSDLELQSFMGTKPFSWLSFFNSSGLFKDDFLAGDQQNLTYFYRDNGFAEATVTSPLAFMDRSKTDIGVSFYIEQGERFHIGKISVQGDVILTEEEIKEKLTLKEGKIYRISKFNQDMKILKNIYGDKGYAFAYIYPSFQVDRKNRIYDITYTVTKKEKAYFRKIVVEGNVKTRENVILRSMMVSEGQLYHATNIDKSKTNLSRLAFFESVDVMQNGDEPNHAMDLKILVKEKSTGTLSASIGASPNTSGGTGITFFGNLQYQERNLLGYGYGLGANLQLSPSPSGNGNLNYTIGLNFSNPSLYDGPWSFGSNLNYSYQVLNATSTSSDLNNTYITQKTISTGVNVGREIVENLRFILGYSLAKTTSEPSDPLIGKFYASGRTEEISQTLLYDDTDNNDMPTSGLLISATNTFGIKTLFGEYDYGKASGQASLYLPIDLGQNYRSNFRLAFIPQYVYETSSNSSIPYWKRLSLGNSYYMKGYSSQGEIISPTTPVNISPVTGQTIDLLIGGNRSYYGTLEYFIPIIPEAGLRMVSFLEAGTVLDDYDGFSLQNVKYDAGFGFRWKTPIAPFRFEWAFPLQNGQLGKAHFIFTIGQDNIGF